MNNETATASDEKIKEPAEDRAKSHHKLGFKYEQADRMTEQLDLLIANCAIHYQKLRNFHWNVVGPDFFDLHEQYEQQYNWTKLTIDALAERIRVFGMHPCSTLQEYLDLSEVQEVPVTTDADATVREVLNDIEIILTHLTATYEVAYDIADVGTSRMVQRFIEELETKFWMFTAFSKKAG